MEHLDLQDESLAIGTRTPLGRSHDDEETPTLTRRQGRAVDQEEDRTKSPDDESTGLWEEGTSSGDSAPKDKQDGRRSVHGLL
jgi:hypothetical protein